MRRHAVPASRPLAAVAVIVTLLVGARELYSIAVAPHAIFLSDGEVTSEMTLYNGSQVPEEVDIEFLFGYPVADSTGTMTVPLAEVAPEGEPAAHTWLRAFPRRLRVEPGERRIVRLQASPPEGLTEGEYWARAVVTSRRVRETDAGPDTTSSMGLNFVFKNVISVNFRNGRVDTGLAFDSLWTTPSEGELGPRAWVALRRTGNSAFLGSVQMELRDAEGTLVSSSESRSVAVYRELVRYYDLAPDLLLEEVPAGEYALTVRISTEREDIDERHVLPAPPVERTTTLTIR